MQLMEPLLLTLFLLARSVGAMTAASASGPRAATSASATDYLALMSFRSLTVTDPSQAALSSWGNRSVPMCQWRGVTCGTRGRRRGRVVALDLPGLNLAGVIAPSLGSLTFLRRLHLPANRLAGVLPSELGHLRELRHLNLSYNFIRGQIPVSLSNCTSLENISLNYNNLTGEIPPEMGSLARLAYLGLSYNQLTGSIPSSLGNLSMLTFASLYSNYLTGSIPSLQGLSSLTTLELGKNNLKGTIPSSLGNLSTVTYIDLHKNTLVGHIPESLGNLRLLTVLDLSENNLTGPIPYSFGKLTSLANLYLLFNELEGYLPPPIFNLSSIEILSVHGNKLSGTLPIDMGNKFPKLKSFTIGFNRFHGTIPPSLCNASMLEMIQLEVNFLSGAIPQCLGTRQQSLSVVAMAENELGGTNGADWGFLSSLTNCSNLMALDVGDNRLHGSLPNSIGNLSVNIKSLLLGYNNMTGEIPDGIGNLVNLELLEMNLNFLEGTIPASVGNLNRLYRLFLGFNHLSGSIPPSIGNLTQLYTLTLGWNALSGGIPTSLSNCPLQLLDLSYNKFTGPIPKELFLISTLSDSLHLEHNFLSGNLPSEVGNLTNLAMLYLAKNMISGEIPGTIGECQSLEYLNISWNFLQGTMPPSIGQLKGLMEVDLSYNNLSGNIPSFFSSMRGLTYLNLSFNNFEGEVPKDGIFSNATATSVVGNAALCGGSPELKLPLCSKYTTRKKSWKIATAISIGSAILCVTLVFAFCHQIRKSRRANPHTPLIIEQYMRVSYAELVNSTNGFSSENLIGVGSFGSVYKGRMRSNEQQVAVAVKVLNLAQRGASQSFLAECEALRCVRHRNLVKILTVCSSINFQGLDFKALVFEFLPNGNLDHWLHHAMENGEHKALDLTARLCIAIDVASALEYLHQHKPLPIIHCDLKPSNIILDGDMVAHVGDFGLARFLHQDSDREKSSGWASMRGTIGYAAPEYGLGNEVSTQGDVYSYGILLLEMFTGKRPTDSKFGEALGLRKYVQMALPDRAAIVIDQHLLPETEDGEANTSNSNNTRDLRIACITSILRVGISCSGETATDRVQIGDALKELLAIRGNFHKQLSGEGASSSQ